jgi:predicted nucleic acid-binding protein
VIVVDTNIIAYLVLGGGPPDAAEARLRKDPEWAAPPLWRSEFANVLALHVRSGRSREEDARYLLGRATSLIRIEPRTDTAAVLDLALASGCTAYDCEFIAAAIALGTRLVTTDRELLRRFPDVAVALVR